MTQKDDQVEIPHFSKLNLNISSLQTGFLSVKEGGAAATMVVCDPTGTWHGACVQLLFQSMRNGPFCLFDAECVSGVSYLIAGMFALWV